MALVIYEIPIILYDKFEEIEEQGLVHGRDYVFAYSPQDIEEMSVLNKFLYSEKIVSNCPSCEEKDKYKKIGEKIDAAQRQTNKRTCKIGNDSTLGGKNKRSRRTKSNKLRS